MHVIIVQPALPSYRVRFFERVAEQLGTSFLVYASHSQDLGILSDTHKATWRRELGEFINVLPGAKWQVGALSIPVARGDILVVCGAPRDLSTLMLILKGRMKGAHVVWWGHYWSSTSRPWRAAVRLALMKLANSVMFYTEKELAEYKGHGRPPRGKLLFGLNNGIETREIARLRTPYDPAKRSRDLLFIGRLTPKADFALLLDALVRPECASVTVDVIGDGEEAAILKQRAGALGLADRVSWHGGTVVEEHIAEIANRCKVFVYPGSVGLSLLHGLSYGLPAIVHDDRWTQMPEIAALDAGRNGRLFTAKSSAALAEVIAKVLHDEDDLRRLSQSAIATTAETFNVDDMVKRFCAAITTITANK